MRFTITTVAAVLALIALYVWGGSWLQNLGTIGILTLYWFSTFQPPKKGF